MGAPVGHYYGDLFDHGLLTVDYLVDVGIMFFSLLPIVGVGFLFLC